MNCRYPEEEEWVESPELFEGCPPDFPVRFGIHVSGHDWFLYAVGSYSYDLQMTDGIHIGSTRNLLEADLHQRYVLPLDVALLQWRLAHNAMMARMTRPCKSRIF